MLHRLCEGHLEGMQWRGGKSAIPKPARGQEGSACMRRTRQGNAGQRWRTHARRIWRASAAPKQGVRVANGRPLLAVLTEPPWLSVP